MNGYHRIIVLSYRLAWVFAAAAITYRLLIRTGIGWRIYEMTGVVPSNLFQMSILLFVIVLASEAYGRSSATVSRRG
ncbi:MAG: hypothetical protein ACRD2M_00455 [Terriglobales bacterium]